MNRKRPKQIVIRLSEQEFEDLKIKVEQSGKTQQQYIIEALTKKRVVNTDGLKEVAGELKRQGNNLNQIAKRLNQMEPVSYGQFQEDIKEFTQIWQLLKQSLQKLGCLTKAMRRILDSHACMIESRKPLFGGKSGEVLVDVEQLSKLQDTARFWEGLQEKNRTLQEKLIKENNRRHDLETKLSVQADDIKRKRELIEELGELIMAEKGFTTNEEYVEWYLKNRKTSQN